MKKSQGRISRMLSITSYEATTHHFLMGMKTIFLNVMRNLKPKYMKVL
nr:MAG TPA: hypothetical protein [Caudoviricetes sp.]